MGPPMDPPVADNSLRWMPKVGELPAYPQPAGNLAGAVDRPVGHQRESQALVGGRYRLIRALGQGPLTETWEAAHAELERAVAIKFVRTDAAAPGVAEAMVQEARAVAQIRHPHVLEYSDFGRSDAGQPFFVMELLAGQTVEQLLARRGVVAWARSVAIAQQVGEALGAAHQRGIVHRDLRPGNVFLVDTGQVGDFIKVVDFGLARGTQLGGTPGYMSPEQCRGEPLDPRSDVYALGCLLFAMVTGEPPFVGDPRQVVWQQLNEAPKSLRERAPRQFIPDELEAIVARCLAKLPSQRFADTRELAAELAHLAQFSAAASLAGAPIQDASASSSRPMGFAGRPPPRSPRELTDSYKPVNQPIVDDAPTPDRAEPAHGRARAPAPSKGMSGLAIVAFTLAGVIAVSGVGVGMYLLVNRLIQEQAKVEAGEAAGKSEDKIDHEPAPLPPVKLATPAAPPEPESTVAEPSAIKQPAAAPASAEPVESDARAKQPAKQAAPAKPKVEPEPEPEPVPNSKPLVEPDSKAKNKIGHDELRDPWG